MNKKKIDWMVTLIPFVIIIGIAVLLFVFPSLLIVIFNTELKINLKILFMFAFIEEHNATGVQIIGYSATSIRNDFVP